MSVVIDIAAQFTGRKAFNQAGKSLDKLGKTLKHAVLGAGLLAFTTSAVKGFIADDKAAQALGKTISNLGLDNTGIEDFISKTSLAAAVSDDELRPALSSLITATKNVSAAQAYLGLALDISAGTGQNLTSVSLALAQAQGGNFKALKKLSPAITKADIATGDLDLITSKLAKTYKGQAALAANSFAGKLKKIGIAINEAKESIGKGIVTALMTATNSANIDALQTKIIDFGVKTGEAIAKLGVFFRNNLVTIKTTAFVLGSIFITTKLIAGINATIVAIGLLKKAFIALKVQAILTAVATFYALNPLVGTFLTAAFLTALTAIAIKYGDVSTAANELANVQNKLSYNDLRMQKGMADAQAKRDAAALKAAAKLAALQKAEIAKTAALKKAAAFFDTERIGLNAALLAATNKEDRLRIEAKIALLDENAAKALAIENQILKLQNDNNALLIADINSIDEAQILADHAKMERLQDYINLLKTIPAIVAPGIAANLGVIPPMPKQPITIPPQPPGGVVTQPPGSVAPALPGITPPKLPHGIAPMEPVTDPALLANMAIMNEYYAASAELARLDIKNQQATSGNTIILNVAGSIVTQTDIVSAINTAQTNTQASGRSGNFSRLGSSYFD